MDENKLAYPPHRTHRLDMLERAIDKHGGHNDSSLKEARSRLWLMEVGSRLDDALGFDDDLKTVVDCAVRLYRFLYRRYRNFHYDNANDYEALKLVKQIALAPDREWGNKPSSEIGEIHTYDHMQKFCLFMLYDHQSRASDLEMAKTLSDFMGKWSKIHGKTPPAKIDLQRDFEPTSPGHYTFVKDRDEYRKRRLNVYDWVSRDDIPALVGYLYETQSPLTGQVIRALPTKIRYALCAPERRSFIHESKIAVHDFSESTLHFVGWAVGFLAKTKEGGFCTNDAMQAYADVMEMKSQGVATLKAAQREAEKAERDWTALFSPKPT